MKLFLSRVLVLFCVCLAARAAEIDAPCLYREMPWTCFGTIELDLHAQTATASDTLPLVVLRYSSFTNGELMIDSFDEDHPIGYLRVGSGPEMTRGLTEGQRTIPGKSPFQFFDMPLAGIVTVLGAAYPEGPASVPQTETSKTVDVKSWAVTLVTTRSDANHVAYRLQQSNGETWTGRWSGPRLMPLPDDYPLSAWDGGHGEHWDTLGAARAATTR